MKALKSVLLLTLLALNSVSFAESPAEKEAARLLNMMGMEKMLTRSMSQMLDIQLQQNPAMAPYKNVMLEFLNKHMSYESLKPDMIKVYTATFTVDELREINAFYATEVGQKTIRELPGLMAQGAQLGARRVQENIGELQQMIQAESRRLQELQQ